MEEVSKAMPRVLNLDKPAVRTVSVFILTFFLVGLVSGPVRAEVAPTINSLRVPGSVKEMGVTFATVSASDGDGDTLTYSWSFDADPTGQAFFFDDITATYPKTASGTFVVFGVGNPGENPPSPSLQGQQISVKVSVSDGDHTVVETRQVLVSGSNLKPVIDLDTAGMGTEANPKVRPGGLSLIAADSFDPDGSIRFFWGLGSILGGQACPGKVFVLFGRETDKPSLPLPLVTAFPSNPMRISFVYRVLDGMYVLEDSVVGWAASPNGCNDSGGGGNTRPTVGVSASTGNAAWGETVSLFPTAHIDCQRLTGACSTASVFKSRFPDEK